MPDLSQTPNRLLPSGYHRGHKTIILAGIIISFFIIILALTIANSRSSFFGRAASPSTQNRPGSLSLENSYLFASPISALGDGTSIIRVTAIVLNDTGLGISGQKVNLKAASSGLTITQVQPITDTFGRAIFDVTSNTPGSYTISAEVSGGILPQTVAILFR